MKAKKSSSKSADKTGYDVFKAEQKDNDPKMTVKAIKEKWEKFTVEEQRVRLILGLIN